MIPGRYDIVLYDGDSYLGPLIVLPDLTPFGGPSDLTAATVRAQPFTAQVVDAQTRQVRLTMTPEQVSALEPGFWTLQLSQPSLAFVGTVLGGRISKMKEGVW